MRFGACTRKPKCKSSASRCRRSLPLPRSTPIPCVVTHMSCQFNYVKAVRDGNNVYISGGSGVAWSRQLVSAGQLPVDHKGNMVVGKVGLGGRPPPVGGRWDKR